MDLRTEKAKRFLLEHSNFHCKKELKKTMTVYDINTTHLGKALKVELKERSYCKETGKLLEVITEETVHVPIDNLDISMAVEFESVNCKCFVQFKSLVSLFNEEISNRISKLKFRYRNLGNDVMGNPQVAYATLVRTVKYYNR